MRQKSNKKLNLRNIFFMLISVIYNSMYSQLFNQNLSDDSMLILLYYFHSLKYVWSPFFPWISVQKIPISGTIQCSSAKLQKNSYTLILPLLFSYFLLSCSLRELFITPHRISYLSSQNSFMTSTNSTIYLFLSSY